MISPWLFNIYIYIYMWICVVREVNGGRFEINQQLFAGDSTSGWLRGEVV